MKKALLLFLALFIGIITSESIVKLVIKYPKYGVENKVHYRNNGEFYTNIWKPYSKYWSVEGGNHIFQRNNLGLQGLDVLNLVEKSMIVILGSSYIEANQVPPQKIASQIFSDKIGDKFNVVNLGKSGHYPIDSWFRLKYFENQ